MSIIKSAISAATNKQPAPVVPGGPAYTLTSHVDGRNTILRVYENRIELERQKGMLQISKKGTGTETLPLRAVTSVTTKRGLLNTLVTVTVAGNEVQANVSHAEAEAVKQFILSRAF